MDKAQNRPAIKMHTIALGDVPGATYSVLAYYLVHATKVPEIRSTVTKFILKTDKLTMKKQLIKNNNNNNECFLTRSHTERLNYINCAVVNQSINSIHF